MAKLNKAQAKEAIDLLISLYPNAECALHFGTIYQLLVAVVLSAQTTDKSVNEVTPVLFAKYPDAQAVAGMEEPELQEILKRIGMYRTKAKNVLNLSRVLVDKYDGVVPEDYDKLIELPGVGRKTANVVLSVGFGHQRIAVDTHVFRLANRIGFVAETDVLATELALMKVLPEDCWSAAHHALIFHGRQVCTARNPHCEECGIAHLCKKNTMTKSAKEATSSGKSKPATKVKKAEKTK